MNDPSDRSDRPATSNISVQWPGVEANALATVLGFLRRHGIRITGARARLLRAIPPDLPFRAEEVWLAARREDPELGRATAFRTLRLLLEFGLLEPVDTPDGSRLYRLCLAGTGEHHHHLVCSTCGQDIAIDGDTLLNLENVVRKTQAAYDYLPGRHLIQLFGVCPRCQALTVKTGANASSGGNSGGQTGSRPK